MTSADLAQDIIDRLAAPVVEMRFLLDRGYRRAHALRVVGEHHQLPERDRNVLERVVFPLAEAEARQAHLIPAADVAGQALVIDGYNVLISVECLLRGEPLFLADDGVVRDIASRRGLRDDVEAAGTLRLLGQQLLSLAPRSVEVVLDHQVSRSGELAETCRRCLGAPSLVVEARTASQADRAIIEASRRAVACSSDRVIIDNAPRVLDLVQEIASWRGALIGHALPR